MNQKTVFASLAVCGLAAAASGQIRLSQSTDEFVVVAGVGVACVSTAAPQTGADNQFSRSFTLTDFGVSTAFDVNTVEFGIETLALPTLVEGTITVNLFEVPAGSPPILGGTLVGSADVVLTDRTEEVVIVDVAGTVSAGAALMVEINVPSFQDLVGGALTGDVYFPGGNSFGQSAPSFIGSTACGLPDPTDYAAIGFPDTHLIIVAEGEEGMGGICLPDIDMDGELTIFDFLGFQNLFDAGDLAADFDGDGVLTIFDFLEFQNLFDAGCP
ncbi:MAG: GC-type dockerin domain-anchored protein [Planctomycetota bacterium]